MNFFKKHSITIGKYISVIIALIGAETKITSGNSSVGTLGTVLFITGIIGAIILKIFELKNKKEIFK